MHSIVPTRTVITWLMSWTQEVGPELRPGDLPDERQVAGQASVV